MESELKHELWVQPSGPGFEFHFYCYLGRCLCVAVETHCTAIFAPLQKNCRRDGQGQRLEGQ